MNDVQHPRRCQLDQRRDLRVSRRAFEVKAHKRRLVSIKLPQKDLCLILVRDVDAAIVSRRFLPVKLGEREAGSRGDEIHQNLPLGIELKGASVSSRICQSRTHLLDQFARKELESQTQRVKTAGSHDRGEERVCGEGEGRGRGG